ncbi:MAG: hypothetical protein HY543_07225 [Deltaproteobacteria bacterium]|nr:hypothetical protein [Deltaproteobacteria bacterium]
MTQDEADNLVAEGIVDNAWQAATLRQVFGEGKDGEITVSERSSLMATGLSAECIAHLAGPDGNAALRARARWFGAMVRNPDTQFKY